MYRNTDGTFADIGAGLPGTYNSALAWGDFDGDGDLDLALSGDDSNGGRIARVYRNTAGTFADIGAGLPEANQSALAWGDFDGDGDLDLALSGGRITRVYRNTAGTFADIGAGLPGVSAGALAWGDYDNDGDLDLAVSGDLNGGIGGDRITRVYRNTAGAFADAGVGLPGTDRGALVWGDYDNDGDLDLAVSGDTGGDRITRVYRNTAGAFTDAAVGLPGAVNSALAWGDFDGDGDLDLVLSGNGDASVNKITRVYRSAGAPPNARPATPTGLTATVTGDDVRLSWATTSDDVTPERRALLQRLDRGPRR